MGKPELFKYSSKLKSGYYRTSNKTGKLLILVKNHPHKALGPNFSCVYIEPYNQKKDAQARISYDAKKKIVIYEMQTPLQFSLIAPKVGIKNTIEEKFKGPKYNDYRLDKIMNETIKVLKRAKYVGSAIESILMTSKGSRIRFAK